MFWRITCSQTKSQFIQGKKKLVMRKGLVEMMINWLNLGHFGGLDDLGERGRNNKRKGLDVFCRRGYT